MCVYIYIYIYTYANAYELFLYININILWQDKASSGCKMPCVQLSKNIIFMNSYFMIFVKKIPLIIYFKILNFILKQLFVMVESWIKVAIHMTIH